MTIASPPSALEAGLRRIDEIADRTFAAWNVPGVAYGVVLGDELIHSRGLGTLRVGGVPHRVHDEELHGGDRALFARRGATPPGRPDRRVRPRARHHPAADQRFAGDHHSAPADDDGRLPDR